MKKTFLFLCIFVMLVPGISRAGEGFEGFHHGFKNPEVKRYIRQNVMPVIREKRQILENELSPAEKSELAGCRSALKDIRAQEHKLRQERRAERQNEGAVAPQNKEALATLHLQRREIMERVEKVADMHCTTISGIRASLETRVRQWTNDIMQIKSAAGDEKGPEYAHKGLGGFSIYGQRATHFFLLMEPPLGRSSEMKSLQENAGNTESNAPAISLSSFSIMPNPASNEIVTGNGPLPASNQVVIFDAQGKMVLSLENVQAAQHIDISTLAPGSYIVQINSGSQVANRQMAVRR